jgi:TPR repeat protein
VAQLAIAAALVLPACAGKPSYAGIPLLPGAADAGLQELARRAQGGDKQAQLDLGIRYEEGRGVAPSRKRAMALYAAAARPSGGVSYVYNPPAAKGQLGSLHRIDSGEIRQGLPEAGRRLIRLRAAKAHSSASAAHQQLEDPR